MTTRKITANDLVTLLNENGAAEFVGIDLITDPTDDMRKKDNPYLGSTKHYSVSGILGYNYENSVNNQLEREGKVADFSVEGRRWGTRINRFLVEHKGQFYITVKVQIEADPIYVKGAKSFPLDEVKPFLYAKKEPARQLDAGVEKVVIHRDFKIASIKYIRMRNEELEIVSNCLPEFQKEIVSPA